MKRTRKGFTLAELLVVVAIIAILVAVAIPVFSGSLEKAREATDAANIRAEYAKMTVEYLNNGTVTATHEVTLVQKEDDWQNDDLQKSIEDLFDTPVDEPVVGKKATLEMDDTGATTLTFEQ